jgi:hypothetical protein
MAECLWNATHLIMKTNDLLAKTVLLTAFILSGHSALGLEIADAAGSWRIINFSMPGRLTVQRDAQGILTGITEANHFERSTGTLNVQANGSFSGSVPDPITGTMALGGQGELIVNANSEDGSQTLTFHINRTADFMTTCETASEGFNDLILGLRAPATLQTSDLAGQWNATAFQTPHHLVLERNSSNQVINIRGLGSFGVYGGVMTINTNGTLSGQIENPFTGTIDSAANGLVNVTINGGEGAMQLTLFVNASKDVMALLDSRNDANDNYQELMIFQKAPTNNVTRDLAAHWRIITFNAPQLTQVTDSFGRVTGLGGSTTFQVARQRLVAGHDGFFTAQVGAVATGTFTPASSGHVTVNVQVPGEGSDSFTFQLNSSQTLLSSSRDIGDGYELLLVTKSAPASGPVRDFGLVSVPDVAGMTLNWAATTNGGLQVSTNLTSWQTISNTVGQHSYTAPAAGPVVNFYRTVEFTP